MEKDVMCAVMLLPVAGAELSSTAVAIAPELCNLCLRQHISTAELAIAVLATTDPNLLTYGSTAVAKDTGYCCRPAIQEVGVGGGSHRWM